MTKDEMLKERDLLAEECPRGECREYYLEGFNAALELIERERVQVFSSPDSEGKLFEWSQDRYPGCTHVGNIVGIETLAQVKELE